MAPLLKLPRTLGVDIDAQLSPSIYCLLTLCRAYMSAHGDQHMFSHARNVDISGGTFIINPVHSRVNGFKILLENISQGAFHDAAERGDPPRCLPRTRVAIRADIMEWIQAPRSMRKLILWMYGPAGAGKTAIAQRIAEECERLGLLTASFFFWRSAAGRNTVDKFVATLAYQLSRYVPQMKGHLVAAIEDDPVIFSRSLATQMRVLVIKPLKLASPSLLMPIAAIVDGVDECGPDGQAQSDLLHQLGAIASELQHLPLIILISSRPECEIREAFNGHDLSSLAKVLVLDNHYKPDEDIKLYFDSTFREIHDKNVRLGFRLPSRWPSTSDMNFLVSKASGQFIFASTVTKFVNSSRHNPVDRLNMVLHLSSVGNETPFAPLDALYRFILGSVIDVENVLQVLTWLLLEGGYSYDFTLGAVEELLGFDIRRALVDMHALLSVPPLTDSDEGLPEIYHASLFDFLTDRSRSLEYYVDKTRGHTFLARRWLKVIKIWAQSRTPTRLALDLFLHHCDSLKLYHDEDLVNDLAHFDLRAFLERSSNLTDDLHMPDWKEFLECVNELGGGREDVFPRLRNDFDAFILNCIGQYPQSLQPYISALLLDCCYIFEVFNVLLHGVSESAEELNKWRKLDERLLRLGETHHRKEPLFGYIHDLLKDAARAGKHFVQPGSYAALLKATVNVIYAQPEERNYQITFVEDDTRYLENDSDPTMRIALEDQMLIWFGYFLAKEPMDLDLAHFLRERTIQFRNDVRPMPGRRNIAKASINYILRCGIPFLPGHAHQPYTNECGICNAVKDGAFIIQNVPSISTELPPLPPVSELSDADIESVVAFADAFDTTPYPFTHILQFSTSPSNRIDVSFTGDKHRFGYLY